MIQNKLCGGGCGVVIPSVNQLCLLCARNKFRHSFSPKKPRRYNYTLELCPGRELDNHYWIIDRGGKGICKFCSTIKQFNRLDEMVCQKTYIDSPAEIATINVIGLQKEIHEAGS